MYKPFPAILVACLLPPGTLHALPPVFAPLRLRPLPAGRAILQAEQAHEEVLLLRQREQTQSLKRQMEGLKIQVDILRLEMTKDAAETGRGMDIAGHAATHGLHLPLAR